MVQIKLSLELIPTVVTSAYDIQGTEMILKEVMAMLDDRSNTYNCCSDQKGYSNRVDEKYCVRVGTFRNYNKAMELQLKLVEAGYPVDIERSEDSYVVITCSIRTLDQAATLEYYIRLLGYSTVICYADSFR